MIRHFDHITFVVSDVPAARRFFELLGFVEEKSVVISGGRFEAFMGIGGIEAEHHTLVLAGKPRQEVQLLKYLRPLPIANADLASLRQMGFNHICFAVDDIEAEVRRLEAHGIERRNEVMEFHDRKLVFLRGPEGITVELAQWL